MLNVKLQSFSQACRANTGGISDVLVFDPADFDFTQVAPVAGVKQPYSAVALNTGATAVGGAKVFNISFTQDEAEWTWKQAAGKGSSKFDHEFVFQLQENSQTLTTFQEALDAAGVCGGLGMIIRLNTGKIFVAGEKVVNGSSIPRFTLKQDGSEGGSGKLYDDFNGGNIHLKGSYNRNLYEFSGDWSAIEDLM